MLDPTHFKVTICMSICVPEAERNVSYLGKFVYTFMHKHLGACTYIHTDMNVCMSVRAKGIHFGCDNQQLSYKLKRYYN